MFVCDFFSKFANQCHKAEHVLTQIVLNDKKVSEKKNYPSLLMKVTRVANDKFTRKGQQMSKRIANEIERKILMVERRLEQ